MDAAEIPQKKRHGCFFYGCITMIVLALIVAVLGFIGIHYVANAVNLKLDQYTETQALVFPKVAIKPDQLKELQDRVAAFNAAIEAHHNTLPLILTSDDINALLAGDTNLTEFRNKVYVDVEGDKVKGQLSLPLGKYFRIPMVHFKGRYLNGSGTFSVGVSNQILYVYITDLEVKGRPLPSDFMTQLRGRNLAQDF